MVQYAILIVLLIMVIALFITSYMRKKKYNTELAEMREELKIGDKVMTDTGVVGEVVDSFLEDEYKYFVLKTGRNKNIGYFTVHANAIYYVFGHEEAKKVNMANVKKDKRKDSDSSIDADTKLESNTETNANEIELAETKIDGEVVKTEKPKKKNYKN